MSLAQTRAARGLPAVIVVVTIIAGCATAQRSVHDEGIPPLAIPSDLLVSPHFFAEEYSYSVDTASSLAPGAEADQGSRFTLEQFSRFLLPNGIGFDSQAPRRAGISARR
jgi:hypothetical protein